MSSNLPPVPFNAPFLDAQGMLAPIWRDWLTKAFQRMGGSIAETNDELYTITGDRIPTDAITTPKIAASAVTDSKLATDSVTTDKILNLAVTAAKLAGSIPFAKLLSTDWSSSQSSSGYLKIPSGLYIQWGSASSIASGGTSSVSLPITFPTAIFQAFAVPKNNSGVATTATGQIGTGNYSTSGFTIYNRTSVTQDATWLAIGN